MRRTAWTWTGRLAALAAAAGLLGGVSALLAVRADAASDSRGADADVPSPQVVTRVRLVEVAADSARPLGVLFTLTKGGTAAVTSAVSGLNCGENCTSTAAFVPAGTPVTLNATGAAGAVFTWGGGCALAVGPVCTVTPTGDTVITLDVKPATGPLGAPTVSALNCRPAMVLVGEKVNCFPTTGGNVNTTHWSATNGEPALDDHFSFSPAFGAAGQQTITLEVCDRALCNSLAQAITVIARQFTPTFTVSGGPGSTHAAGSEVTFCYGLEPQAPFRLRIWKSVPLPDVPIMVIADVRDDGTGDCLSSHLSMTELGTKSYRAEFTIGGNLVAERSLHIIVN